MGRDRSIIVEKFCAPRIILMRYIRFALITVLNIERADCDYCLGCVEMQRQSLPKTTHVVRNIDYVNATNAFAIAPRDLDVTTVSKRNELLP